MRAKAFAAILIVALIMVIAELSESGSISRPPQGDAAAPPVATAAAGPVAVATTLPAGGTDAAAAVEKAFWSRSPLMGRRAPEFALVDDAGSRVSLGSVSGQWVVLHFYPTEDTPDCVCSTHDYTRDLAALDQLDAAVIKVSSATQEQQRVIRGKYGLQRPLFSDVEGKAARLYGAWTEARVEDQVFPRVVRTTLLIDPKGTIRRHWPQVLPGHAARVAETLKSERALDQAMSAQANSAPAGQ